MSFWRRLSSTGRVSLRPLSATFAARARQAHCAAGTGRGGVRAVVVNKHEFLSTSAGPNICIMVCHRSVLILIALRPLPLYPRRYHIAQLQRIPGNSLPRSDFFAHAPISQIQRIPPNSFPRPEFFAHASNSATPCKSYNLRNLVLSLFPTLAWSPF